MDKLMLNAIARSFAACVAIARSVTQSTHTDRRRRPHAVDLQQRRDEQEPLLRRLRRRVTAIHRWRLGNLFHATPISGTRPNFGTIPFKPIPMKLGALAFFALCAFRGEALAVTQEFDVAFLLEPAANGTREVWTQAGQTYLLTLLSQQKDPCTHNDPDPDTPENCPTQATLTFSTVPSGAEVCFTASVNPQVCPPQRTLTPGDKAFVRLTVPANPSFSSSGLSVTAVTDTVPPRAVVAPIQVKVAPPLFNPPGVVKLFRGDLAKTFALPLARPVGLDHPFNLSLLGSTNGFGSTNGISADFSPLTLSTTATSTTMSLAATGNATLGNATLGSRTVAIGAFVGASPEGGPYVANTALTAPFTVNIADAITPVFENNIEVHRAITTAVTKFIRLSALVDADAGGSADQVKFTITGCNCSTIKAQASLTQGNTLEVKIAPSKFINGTLLIGVRATLGKRTRDFDVPIEVKSALGTIGTIVR